MKKARVAAMMLLTFMLGTLTIGCDSGDTVIATVNGESLYKWQLNILVEEQLPTFISQNGVDPTKPENWETMKIFKESLLNEMINQIVSMEKAKELGLDQLSAEELADSQKQYDEQVEANIEYYAQNYKDDPKARDKAYADFQKVMKKKKLTPERVIASINDNKILMKLYQEVFKDFKPNDEQIQAWYDENVAAQKEKFDENPALFGEEGGALQIYVPEGYLRVKHVLIGLPEETKQKIQQLASKQGELVMALANLGGDKANVDKDKLSQQLSETETQISQAREEGINAIRARAEEVLQKAKSGTDFEFLIEQYNDDPGMNVMPGKQLGYLVCPQTTTFFQEFTDAALSLKDVGDISDIVVSSEGCHIIRLYEKLTPGAAPLERIRDTIADIIMKNDTFTPMIEEREKWKQEMEIKQYLDRL